MSVNVATVFVLPTAAQPLADVKRQAVVDHVLAAARRYVLQRGLDATMDQIAGAAEVSRRTLFRLFGTREHLLAAAFNEGMAWYGRELPTYGGDWELWLRATCDVTHEINSVIGPGFFELSSKSDLPLELVETERNRRASYHRHAVTISTTLWQARGGSGGPPTGLDSAVAAHISPYFTAAVTIEGGESWLTASTLAFEAIVAALELQLAAGHGARERVVLP
jgi:AcrR family transcriptional regulator